MNETSAVVREPFPGKLSDKGNNSSKTLNETTGNGMGGDEEEVDTGSDLAMAGRALPVQPPNKQELLPKIKQGPGAYGFRSQIQLKGGGKVYREEFSGADGFIVGSYLFVRKEGIRMVRYKASMRDGLQVIP